MPFHSKKPNGIDEQSTTPELIRGQIRPVPLVCHLTMEMQVAGDGFVG